MNGDTLKRISRVRALTRREIFRVVGMSVAAAAGFPNLKLLRALESRLPGMPGLPPVQNRRTVVACVVKPPLEEGPFFVDEKLNRSDIRADPLTGVVKAGLPLRLVVNVAHNNGSACLPLAGVLVDVWHCDAEGVYSDASGAGNPSTRGQKFLRGYQVTSAEGMVQFMTIYPGWYQGRTVHIHLKFRTDPFAESAHEFTTQLFFDDALTDKVFAKPPYAANGERNTRNNNDRVYRQGGAQLTLALTPEGTGYAGTADFELDFGPIAPTATPNDAPTRGPTSPPTSTPTDSPSTATPAPSATERPSSTSTSIATQSPPPSATPSATSTATNETHYIYVPKVDRH